MSGQSTRVAVHGVWMGQVPIARLDCSPSPIHLRWEMEAYWGFIRSVG